MKKNKRGNEELQSRREFFKEAAKKALPVIGAIALATSPSMAQFVQLSPSDCKTGCTGGCKTGCEEGCSHNCNTTCKDTCKEHCHTTCKGSATNYAK